MKRIYPRTCVMLIGLLMFAIGIINRLPVTIGMGILLSIYALIRTIEAEMYNRAQWNRLIKYYLKERNERTKSDMRVEMADVELEELTRKLRESESKPSTIYVGGFSKLTEALNKAHARNRVKTVGSEVND